MLRHLPGPEPEPEPDPIWKIWLPETPWRPMPPPIPAVEHWECRICGAQGCPVPGYPQMDGGVDHVRTEHADAVAAAAEAADSLSTEPEETPMETPEPDPDLLAMAEALNKAVRQMSDLLLGACRTLEREGWTPEQARALVLKTYLGSFPS